MSLEAKVAQTAAKLVEQSAKQSSQSPLTKQGDSPFMAMLEQHEMKLGAIDGDMMQALGIESSVHPADNAISAQNLDIQTASIEQLDSVESPDKIASMLTTLNKNGLEMERIMELITSGTKFGNRELLLLQGAMHQLSWQAEVAVRYVDGVKSVINNTMQSASR